ncbi:hypothetical protein F3087_04775 [Nocardia colli]|uniref:Uncharacterized protein n=1 Tax=Nocardia colli TaxID=2545717 RepID=A0A5N0EQB5_9NOCA|nr:hypothetical protein [Nocardia colli]KAA8890584.1 hypothetical protein F3087_04775 [Nocardia colli]
MVDNGAFAAAPAANGHPPSSGMGVVAANLGCRHIHVHQEGGGMRSESEIAVYEALKPDYRRIVDTVDLFPRGIQARLIAKMTHPRSWEIDKYDIDSQYVKAVRAKLARLESKGFVTIERTAEYGNIYRPVNSQLDMATWTLDQGREYYAERHARRIGADQLAVAAYSMVLGVWRNTIVEDAHASSGLGRISDGEMFAANVAIFRMMCDFLGAADRTYAAWHRLSREVIRPDRIAAGSRTVADLLGEYYEEWARDAASAVMYYAELTECDDHDMEWFIAVKSCFGSVQGNWFGMPDWPRVVDAFVGKGFSGLRPLEEYDESEIERSPRLVERARTPRVLPIPAEELSAGLLDGPDRMDPEVLGWCIGDGIGFIRGGRE